MMNSYYIHYIYTRGTYHLCYDVNAAPRPLTLSAVDSDLSPDSCSTILPYSLLTYRLSLTYTSFICTQQFPLSSFCLGSSVVLFKASLPVNPCSSRRSSNFNWHEQNSPQISNLPFCTRFRAFIILGQQFHLQETSQQHSSVFLVVSSITTDKLIVL